MTAAALGDNRIAYFGERVTKVWQNSVEGIVDAGRILIEAREEFKQKELPFSDLVGDSTGKESQLPFAHACAYKLIAVASSERIIAHVSELPPSWETLYALLKLSDERFMELLASGVINPGMRRKDIKQAETAEKVEKRKLRERDLGLEMPTGSYGVIVCDDEWDMEVWSRETGMDRHAATHYETASDAHTAEELHERTRARFACAAANCVLFMWTTPQHLAIAIKLMALRGFEYKSNYVWAKDHVALGFWNRNKHEHLLIGVRGDIPCPAPGQQWESLIDAPAGEHSEKPEIFLQMIEFYFPNLPKIELNRRRPARPGWSAWGNEATPSQQEMALSWSEQNPQAHAP